MSMYSKFLKRFVSALLSVSFVLCCLLSFPAKKADAIKGDPTFEDMAEQIVVMVNEARVNAGLNPIYMVPYLCEVSKVRTEECAVTFSHQRLDGANFTTAIDTDIVPYANAAENLAAGMNTAEATFNQWRNSERHWGAVMNPVYTHMGVAVYYDPDSQWKWYWEQCFVSLNERYAIDLPGQYYPEKYKIVPKSTGDINGDGVVNTFDYIVLLQYIKKEYFLNPLQLESADILYDGSVTIADAIILKQYILGKQKSIPLKLF